MYSKFLNIPDNEWEKISYFKGHKTTPKFLSIEDLNEIISKFCMFENRLMNPFKTEVFITFVYMTGLRKNEILTLKREAFNFDDNRVKIRIVGKGDKERFVFISEKYSPKLRQKILDYFSSEPETINSFNVTLGEIDYMFRKMNKYTNKHVSCHSFRHSYSKYLLDKGVAITYIQALLGHSSLNTTMIYLNPTQEQVSKAFK
jgi:site-specific recombinase XerD